MYHMTVFDDDGKKLLDEPIEAESDAEAKQKGMAFLEEQGHETRPYRIFHTTGRLIAFYSHKAKLTNA